MDNINSLIDEYHNPDLLDKNAAPNGNIQTLIFNDGEILTTKGGSAFLQRSMFTIKGPINNLKFSITFPKKLNENTFAMVKDLEIANLIRSEMEKYNNSI